MNYIHIVPNTGQQLLDIFNEVCVDGNAYFLAHSHKENPISLKDVCRQFESIGWGLFSFAQYMPIDKIKFEVLIEHGKDTVAFQLAPFLGLPGENHSIELLELESFLMWFKEEAKRNPTQQLRLVLDAVGDDAQLRFTGKNKEQIEQLNTFMQKHIEYSANLTQWLENQKKAILAAKAELKLFDLYATLLPTDLMSQQQINDYNASIDPDGSIAKARIKEQQKSLKSRK